MLDRRTLLASAAALSAAPALESVFAPSLAAPSKPGSALNALFDQFMTENLDNSPMTVTSLGLDKGARAAQKSRLDDASPAGLAKPGPSPEASFPGSRRSTALSSVPRTRSTMTWFFTGLQASDESDNRFAYGAPGGGQPYIFAS